MHFSLWDADGRSALYDPAAERGLSAVGRQFLAGVLEHLPALVALTTPSYNSSRRLAPGAWASSTRSWGFDNKEVALRVVSPFFQREEASYNVEYKVSDPSANPYLAMGALVAAGLDGVERGLTLPDPCEHDPARLSAADRERCGVAPLPVGMAAGLDALEADGYLLGTHAATCSRGPTSPCGARRRRRSPRRTRSSSSATTSTGSDADGPHRPPGRRQPLPRRRRRAGADRRRRLAGAVHRVTGPARSRPTSPTTAFYRRLLTAMEGWYGVRGRVGGPRGAGGPVGGGSW